MITKTRPNIDEDLEQLMYEEEGLDKKISKSSSEALEDLKSVQVLEV